MRIKRLIWLLPMLLIAAVSAKADTDYVYVNGSYAFASYGYAVGPYGGSVNGNSAQFYCVDFNDQISGNTGWYANATNLTSASGYGQTLQKDGTFYLKTAWLITQMRGTSNKSLEAQYQWAIWYLSLGSVLNSFDDPYGKDVYWAGLASDAVVGHGFSVSGWQILTPTGGYGQEFIVPYSPGAAIPEPSTVVLLFAGLAVFFALALRK